MVQGEFVMETLEFTQEADKRIRYNSLDKLIFSLYFLYFVVNPLYLWKSGLPQIADILLVLIIVIYFIANRFKFSFDIKSKAFLLNALFLVVWVLLINFIWILLRQEFSNFFINSIFYLYNFLVLLTIIILYNKYGKKILELTYKSILLSIFIQLLYLVYSGGFSGFRATGTFNNPNQLGYYAVLALSYLVFLNNKIKIQAKWYLLCVFTSLILVSASLSKAAIVSTFSIFVLSLFTNNEVHSKRKITFFILLISFLVIIVNNQTNLIQENKLINSVISRVELIGKDSDDSIEKRGYDRITNYPEYWLFGAGEGAYNRFGYPIELHSTLGNIQASYGIVGTLIFLSFIFRVIKSHNYNYWYIMFFIMLYGLTHNGIRESLLWILLALIHVSSKKEYKRTISND
jgi:hypothetical protein